MPEGDQALAEICLKLFDYTRCLGITWNAQARAGTFRVIQSNDCSQTPAGGDVVILLSDIKAATFRPANPQHAGSNYPHGLLRVAQAIFQRTRVLRGYQIFGTHHFIQKLYEIRVS